MSEQTEGAEVEALPVTREIVPKGITVYPDGSSLEVHWDYTVLHAGRIVAQPRAAVVAARGAEGGAPSDPYRAAQLAPSRVPGEET